MKQHIKGGLGDKLNPRDVDKHQLMMGIKVEMEHTNNPQIAKEIAIDHLAEDPQYYTKLNKAKLEMKLTEILKEMIKSNQPQRSPSPSPGREPMIIPAPTKDPKRGPRRQIGNPDPSINPKPKAEGIKLGWDPKKGLTTPKKKIVGANTPKLKPKNELLTLGSEKDKIEWDKNNPNAKPDWTGWKALGKTIPKHTVKGPSKMKPKNEGIEDKIVQRFSGLKGR